MMKSLLAGAAASAMMTGVALAQNMSSDTTISTQTTTTQVIPAPESFSSSRSQKSIDSYGTETETSQTYSNGANGSRATSDTQTIAPDGSQTSTLHDERSVSPGGDTTTRHTTTTTTAP